MHANKSILLVTTVYRTGEKIYPVLPELTNYCSVDVLNLYQMSSNTPWRGELDMRHSFFQTCESLGCRVFHGPGISKGRENDADETSKQYGKYFSKIDKTLDRRYDLILLDNNITTKGGQGAMLYEWGKKHNSIVVASPHGNREFKGYRVLNKIGKQYDYSFVFGKKERSFLVKADKKRRHFKNRLLPGGIPSNDKLATYKISSQYILIIPNITDPKFIGEQIKHFKPFTKKTFDSLDVLKLAKMYNCEILIKEKNHMFHKSDLLRNSLKSYPVNFVLDCSDDNKLIADAKIVISAPSTMAFKPIQLGIPTAIIKGQGMTGNFADYLGLIECDHKSLVNSIKEQEKIGKNIKYVENTIAGGLDFSCTRRYVNKICDLLEVPIDT